MSGMEVLSLEIVAVIDLLAAVSETPLEAGFFGPPTDGPGGYVGALTLEVVDNFWY